MDYQEFRSHFGSTGWYNVFVLILIGLTGTMFYGATNYGINFLGTHADHWCSIPDLQHLEHAQQLENGVPWDDQQGVYSSCKMYSNYSSTPYSSLVQQTNISGGVTSVDCQYGWAYDTTVRKSTYKMEWNLVCDNMLMSDLVTPLFVFGQFCGALFCGSVSNMLGRKRAMTLWTLLMCVAGVAAACSVNIYMFIIARILVGATGINTSQLGYVLGTELTPPEHRALAGTVAALLQLVGVLLCACMAYFIRGWRLYQFLLAVGLLPFLLAFIVNTEL